MNEADIRQLLAVAADDQDAPAGTPAWLRVERIRSYRRRQRQVGTVAVIGIASTVAGVAITMGAAQHSAAHPASGPPRAGGSANAVGPGAPPTTSASSSPLPGGVSGGLLAPVRTEIRTVGGRVSYVLVPRTTQITTSVPGALRTMLLHDTVTASTTATTTATATATQTDTTTRTVTTTVTHTARVTVTPPPQTVTVTVTATPSPSGPQIP